VVAFSSGDDVLVGRRVAHGAPGVPGDFEDHERDCEPDQRVGDLGTEPDDERARDHAETDKRVDASVVAVRDEGGAGQPPSCPQPDAGGHLVPEVADEPGTGQHPQVLELLRVHKAQHRLVERYTGGDEDREDDGVAGPALATRASEEKGSTHWTRGQGITGVVDQIGEERDAIGEDKNKRLRCRRGAQDREANEDSANAGARAQDRSVDETVSMAVLATAAATVEVVVRKRARVLGVVSQEASSICSE
jgi:hypothetical protein